MRVFIKQDSVTKRKDKPHQGKRYGNAYDQQRVGIQNV